MFFCISLYIKILVNVKIEAQFRRFIMYLMTFLLMWFGMMFFGTPEAEAQSSQASIIQRVEPGLIAAYDQAKTTIKE